ncbi:hypothetical protein [Leifsonia kafniensis]|uniref:hypothetical protein n=1 Tax=Leifsonia kafniensis TaxID=475957 RepID=UPI0031E688C4
MELLVANGTNFRPYPEVRVSRWSSVRVGRGGGPLGVAPVLSSPFWGYAWQGRAN